MGLRGRCSALGMKVRGQDLRLREEVLWAGRSGQQVWRSGRHQGGTTREKWREDIDGKEQREQGGAGGTAGEAEQLRLL